MKDRAALLPNRRKITYADGSVEYVTIEFADQPSENGTLLNKANLLSDSAASELGLAESDPVPSDALISLKRGAIQYSTMPTASAEYLEKIVFFSGTTGTYTHGHIYECLSSGGESPTYSWNEVHLNPTAADQSQIVMLGGYGVNSGCAVSAQSTPNQTVSVSSGVIITPLGVPYSISSVSSFEATAADATNPRIDIVYVTSAGVVTYLAGTAAGSPTQPSTPANGTILAAISRPANDNTIATSDITDQRDFITVTSDFEDVTAVTEVANAYACDFAKKHTKNFSFSITNATGKTVTFTNVPYGTCDTVLSIKATGTAAVTWTLDGRTLVWPAGAPTLTSGYTYEILFSWNAQISKWIGRAQLGAAN